MQAKLPSARTAVTAASAIGIAVCATSAHASTMVGGFLPIAVQVAAEAQCASGSTYHFPAAQSLPMTAMGPAITKSAAILGGTPSALERIRMQQSGASPSLAGPIDAASRIAVTPRLLEPALGASSSRQSGCSLAYSQMRPLTETTNPALAGAGHFTALPGVSQANDFLASKRISISHTNFDDDWARVRNQGISVRQMRKLTGAWGSDRTALISAVNKAANHRISYVEDSQLFGKADHWAGARTTLRLGKGDCEDIALVKMQMLAAAGIPRTDMTLTIARDLARNADHAMLIVRHEGRFLLLDNSTDKVLDASYSYDYRPVLSFSEGHAWLHGY